MPGQAYGADFFLESRRLFPRTWCAVAYESDVPTVGDALPVDVAGWPLVVIRGADQRVRVFHNVCRHYWKQIFDEDLSYADRVQKNCERPQTDGIKPRFSPFWEPNVQRFQQSMVALLRDGTADRC